MTEVTVITPPDFIANENLKIVLIYPGVEVRKNINQILKNTNQDVDLYLYEDTQAHDLDWLIQRVLTSDITILDLDHCSSIVKNLAGYLISRKNVFYLTNDEITPYYMISNNRVYDLYWLQTTLERIE
jgi:hypothetical protein